MAEKKRKSERFLFFFFFLAASHFGASFLSLYDILGKCDGTECESSENAV